MRKLDFRVSYNVVLFNFIDALAKWDYFVGGHIRRYFEKYYGLDDKDISILEEYAKIRKDLGWRREMDLFDWAFNGFPEHPEFTALKSAYPHFEQKADKNGMVLKSELEHATEGIKKIEAQIESRFHELDIEERIRLFIDVFESPAKTGSLPCYLAYTPYPDSSQGGANGEGIYTQVHPDIDPDIRVKEATATLSHEYMHKELNPGRYFQFHPDAEKREVYNSKFKQVYPDEYYQFIEEVVVYTLNDVITFHTDPLQRRDRYADKYKDDTDRMNHFVALWQAAHDIQNILRDFEAEKIDKQEATDRLDKYFLDLVKK